jgi:hypothetical protein
VEYTSRCQAALLEESVVLTRLGRARQIASDLLVAIALIWALPLLVAVIYGGVTLLTGR